MAGRDQYMNFFVCQVQHAAASNTLADEDHNTGAGVATQLAWRIHKVEWFTTGSFSGAADGNALEVVLSTRKSQSSMPALIDKGTVTKFKVITTVYGAGTGAVQSDFPKTNDYLPPMIIASPNFSLYAQAGADFSGMQSKYQRLRIGFTTEKLTESAYREVFETWNYAN